MKTHHDEIEQLIRQSFEGPTPDDGFSDRVMQRVPTRRRRATWPIVAGLLVGAVLYAASMLTSPLWRAGWDAWLAGDGAASSAAVISTMTALLLLALGWSLTEADDR